MVENQTKAVKEGGHWYQRHDDGTASQLLTVPKASGKGEKATTLREARLMQLAPGCTTIIRQASNFHLQLWQKRQAIMSALTLPRLPDESEADWLQRVEFDMDETARASAKEGTRIHGAIEQALQNDPIDENYTKHVGGVLALLDSMAGATAEWEAERAVVHPLGYGTKCDLHDAAANWCIDFKTCDKDADQIEKMGTFESHHMQLAATRAALEAQEWGYPHDGHRYEGPRRTCAIVYVSRTHPGVCHAVEVSEKKLAKGWDMFRALLLYWQAKSGFRPAWATC